MWSRVVNQEADEEQDRSNNDAADIARREERTRHFHTLKFVLCGFVITGVGSIICFTWKAYALVYMLGIPAVVFLVLTVLEIIDLIQLCDQASPGLHPAVVQNYASPPQYSQISPDHLSPTNLLSLQVPFTQDEISFSEPSIPIDLPPPYSEIADRSSNSVEGNKSIYVISISGPRQLHHDHTNGNIEEPRDQIHVPESVNEDLEASGHDPPSYEDALAAKFD